MRFELAIGLRYLGGGQRRDRRVFTLLSIIGVALGVAALVIALAVTTGFQHAFRDKVLGVNAHVTVLKQQPTFPEYHDVMRTAKAMDPDEVVAVAPFIYAEMLVTRGKGELSGVAIKGVDPALVRGVLDLDRYMEGGATVDVLAARRDGDLPPIIMGRQLAVKLRAKVGDAVTVVIPLSATDLHARTKRFRVAGMFYSGFDEYDRRLLYAALPDVQELIGRPGQVQGVEIKLRDLERAGDIAVRLEKRLGGKPYEVSDWRELNATMFAALQVQKVVLIVILTLIILVAAVNMVSALAMLVTDKTREVAILRSMGASAGSIAQVFQVVGIAIGGIGTIVGVAVGLLGCLVIDRVGFGLDPKVYLIDRLPVEVHAVEVVLVACIALAISVVATLVPAAGAARMRPVDGLRYD